jgi:hypothetical protein
MGPAVILALLANGPPVPVNVEPLDLMSDQGAPFVTCDGLGCTLAWTRQDMTTADVRERWIDLDGGVGPVSLTLGGRVAAQLQGGGAWTGMRLFVMTPTGAQSDSAVYTLLTHQPFDDLTTADVGLLNPQYFYLGRAAFVGGANLGLLAYVAGGGFVSQMYLRTVQPDGGFAEDASVVPAQSPNEVLDPSLVELNGVFYLLFVDRADATQMDPFLARFSSATAPLGAPVPLRDTVENEHGTSLVLRGDHLLAAWGRDTVPPQVEVQRIDFDGGSTAALLVVPGLGPALTWNGSRGFLAVGGATSAALYALDDRDGGLSALRVFTAPTAGTYPWVNLAQPVQDRVILAYADDDGGSLRSFFVQLGLEPDAAMPDAGTPDAGPSDGGGLDAGGLDAGGPDAGTRSDAGPGSTGTTQNDRIACGCQASGLAVLLLPLALGLLRSRRRFREP